MKAIELKLSDASEMEFALEKDLQKYPKRTESFLLQGRAVAKLPEQVVDE